MVIDWNMVLWAFNNGGVPLLFVLMLWRAFALVWPIFRDRLFPLLEAILHEHLKFLTDTSEKINDVKTTQEQHTVMLKDQGSKIGELHKTSRGT